MKFNKGVLLLILCFIISMSFATAILNTGCTQESIYMPLKLAGSKTTFSGVYLAPDGYNISRVFFSYPPNTLIYNSTVLNTSSYSYKTPEFVLLSGTNNLIVNATLYNTTSLAAAYECQYISIDEPEGEEGAFLHTALLLIASFVIILIYIAISFYIIRSIIISNIPTVNKVVAVIIGVVVLLIGIVIVTDFTGRLIGGL